MKYKIEYNDGSIDYQEFDTFYEAFIHNYKEPWQIEMDKDVPYMIGIKTIPAKALRGNRAKLYIIDDLVNAYEKNYKPKTDFSDYVDVKDVVSQEDINEDWK